MAHPDIDTDGLRKALDRCESMIRFYANSEEKAAQNAALKAAGLKPLHSESQLAWDDNSRREYAREADALRGVLAYFGEDQAEAA